MGKQTVMVSERQKRFEVMQMTLKFVYRSKGYYGTESFFIADFDKQTVCESDKRVDGVVELAKQGGVRVLENRFVRDLGFTVIEN